MMNNCFCLAYNALNCIAYIKTWFKCLKLYIILHNLYNILPFWQKTSVHNIRRDHFKLNVFVNNKNVFSLHFKNCIVNAWDILPDTWLNKSTISWRILLRFPYATVILHNIWWMKMTNSRSSNISCTTAMCANTSMYYMYV